MKKLLILTLASSVLFSDIALGAQLSRSQTLAPNITLGTETNNRLDRTKNIIAKSPTAIRFDTFMKAGYSAFNKKDYKTALTEFKSALAIRPNSIYAKKAVQNTEKKLAKK